MFSTKITLVTLGFHIEAIAWRTAVFANGGTVSDATLRAVSTFCYAIDAAGIRDRFMRLNLFCGNNLASCLVPLYTDTSMNYAHVGNSVDINTGNNFVGVDYSESTGLTGDGSTKILETGVSQYQSNSGNESASLNSHMSVYVITKDANDRYMMGTYDGNDYLGYYLRMGSYSEIGLDDVDQGSFLSSTSTSTSTSRTGLTVGTTNGSLGKIYNDNTDITSGYYNWDSDTDLANICVFGYYDPYYYVAPVPDTDAALGGYSFGNYMTTAQVSSYSSAMQNFQVSMTRAEGLVPTFGTPTKTADGFTVQITNYDAAYAFAGTATASGSVAISGSGLVTVTGVAGNTSSTATITTTRTGYKGGSATTTETSLHAEAVAWKNAVITNSGSVTDATLLAVSNFCASIDANSLRSKMYRVNLFAGTQLAAALVPLYRSASNGGTAYGTSVDTNVNFVGGDYTEGAGLTGGSTKYLNLGDPASLMPSWATHHFGVDTRGDNNANKTWMGCFFNGTPTGIYSDWASILLEPRTGPSIFSFSGNSATQNYSYFSTGATNANLDSKLKLMSRTSSTNAVLYNNASSTPTNTSTVTAANGTCSILPAQFNVFSVSYQNVTSGVPSSVSATYENSSSTFRGYTIGLSLTGAQVSTYNSIWATFRTAMGRP